MRRLLVQPWHGLVKDGAIHLANGTTKPGFPLIIENKSPFGQGDTHKIIVAGVPALDDDEKARTPEGGEYWVGKALVSMNTLYGKPVGWIYQAEDGSRWSVSITGRTILDGSSTLTFRFLRFGEFGKAYERHDQTVTVPVGTLPTEDRSKFFLALGGLNDVLVRVHAVSETGRTVVLAWMAFVPDGSAETDANPRAYTFVKLTLSGTGDNIALQTEVLFRAEDIRRDSEPRLISKLQPESDNTLVEVSRTELYDESGALVGHQVTYDYDETVRLVEGSYFEGALNATSTQEWILGMCFDGEIPSPIRLVCELKTVRSEPNLRVVTVVQPIQNEYLSGLIDYIRSGEAGLSGESQTNSSFDVRIEGASVPWNRTVEFSMRGDYYLGDVTNLSIFDGEAASFTGEGLSGLGIYGSGQLYQGNSSKPMISVTGAGLQQIQWVLDLYSNNLIGMSERRNSDDYAFTKAITSGGVVDYQGAYPGFKDPHYGSYNPVTEQIEMGSPSPVNWV